MTLRPYERSAAESILDRRGDPDSDAAIVARAALRLAARPSGEDVDATPRSLIDHLDFCAGGEFCTLDDCLCECHIRPSGEVDVERLRAAAKDIDDGWHVVDEGREQVRLRYASDLPVRLRRLRAALDGEEGT